MTKNKSTKRALFSSAIAFLLCLTMLIGTTFAWFTDSASSANNIIRAGNLDIEMSYAKPVKDGEILAYDALEWNPVKEDTELFDNDALWEPGFTQAVYLKISNVGSLALKYKLDIAIISEIIGTSVLGDDIKLSDILMIDIHQMMIEEGETPQVYTGRTEGADAVTVDEWYNSFSATSPDATPCHKTLSENEGEEIILEAGDEVFVAMGIYMPTTVGNEANHKTAEEGGAADKYQPSIKMGVNLVATQYTLEEDSFDDQYDKDAVYPWDGTADTSWYNDTDTEFGIKTAEELAGFAQLANAGNNFSGKTINVLNDISLSGKTWTTIKSFAGTLDGKGHTISDFVIDATNSSGGFFNTIESGDSERVVNLTFENIDATVGGMRFGAVANTIGGIVNNVHVVDLDVTTTSGDAWVAGFCAFMSWGWTNNCSVTDMVVNAENGAEFIAGYTAILQKNNNMVYDNCDVNGFTVVVSENDGSCGVAGFAGQTQRGWEYPEVKNCDVSGIDITATGTVDIGGFMVWPGGHTTATNCTTAGVIDATGVTGADYYVGGFFGNLGWNCDLGQMGHKITDCSADVDIISGGAPAGGFVGSATNSNDYSMYATFENCSASGDVTNTNGAAGGFAGDADRGVYTNCTATGKISGSKFAGGFIGHIVDVEPKYDSRYPAGTRDYLVDEITISGCTGSANVTGPDGKAADIVGYIDAGTKVTLTDNIYTGTEANKAE